MPPASPDPANQLASQGSLSGNTGQSSSANDKHGANATIAIIIAILIAATLIGLGYVAYQSADENSTVDDGPKVIQSEDEPDEIMSLDTTSPVDESTINQEVSELEQIVDGTDASELEEEALSDQSLGL